MDNELPDIEQLTEHALAYDEPYFAALESLADARLIECQASRLVTTADVNRRRAWDVLVAARELIASESSQCYIRSQDGTTDDGPAEDRD